MRLSKIAVIALGIVCFLSPTAYAAPSVMVRIIDRGQADGTRLKGSVTNDNHLSLTPLIPPLILTNWKFKAII